MLENSKNKKEVSRNKRYEKDNETVWIKIGLKKLDIYEDVVVDILLDSGVTKLFINFKFVREQKFKLDRLK